MTKIVILGAGLMGSAFGVPLVDNGHAVRLVGTHLDGDIIEELHESGYHPRLKTHLPDGIEPYTYDRLAEVSTDADLVVLGVNSLGVDWATKMLNSALPPDVPVLFLTKGLEGDGKRLDILPDVFRNGLSAQRRSDVRIAAVGGPSIAGEVAAKRHTCVVLTGLDATLLERLAGLMRTPYYHVWTNTDMVGVEVCVAMKNVYALAVGLVNGLLEKEGVADSGAAMHNVAAAIYAQGLWEISYMAAQMGGRRESVISLPGAGDLYVTSMGGRNGRMGRYLGLGMPFSEAKATHMADITIEGAELAIAIGPTVESLIADGTLDRTAVPLLLAMIDIVCHDAPAELPWDDFFAGPTL